MIIHLILSYGNTKQRSRSHLIGLKSSAPHLHVSLHSTPRTKSSPVKILEKLLHPLIHDLMVGPPANELLQQEFPVLIS